MLKLYNYAVALQEFPDEIALCLNISNCPCRCTGCSESYLRQDVGDIITEELLSQLVSRYTSYGISLVGFMGGDGDHTEVKRLADIIHNKYNLKVGMYSGFDYIDLDLAQVLDYYKIGRFILPQGDEKDWHKRTYGPMNFP